ncbi:hypothetical protein Tco_0571775 [Tanacetum coccineum]
MDNPNITMEEYIRLQEEKALSRVRRLIGKLPHTDNTLTSDAAISCEPTEQYGDLAETMIWYMLKKDLMLTYPGHSDLVNKLFAQELIIENYHAAKTSGSFPITTARRVSTVKRIKTRERIKMKIVYQDYLRDKLRIEQYFQVQDYALWDVIENGNSFKPVAQTTTNADGTSTSLIPGPVTFEEKAQRRMICEGKKFGGNKATKKTHKTLLKQMYKNFSALSIESLDSILTSFRRLNKPDLDTMSFDDLYNNFMIVKQEVKGTASSSSSLSSQNMAFVSSPSSTNEDLEQIHEDDIEEMDLKWQLALLSIRIRRFFQKINRKITINGSDTAGYGTKFMVKQESSQSRRTVNVEETSSKAMVAIDGAGFDWSYITDDEVPTNIALMSFSDSEEHNDKTSTYKRGLASVEEQLVFYKKNEVIFCEQLAVLKRDISYKDSEIKINRESEPDKSRKGVGFVSYNAISTPLLGLLSPKCNLSTTDHRGVPTAWESLDALLVKKLMSDDKLEKKTVFPTVAKIEFVRPKQQEKPVRKPVKYAEMYRSQSPRGNQRNWNNQKSQQLGSNFVMYNKACFVYGSFDHVQAHCNYHQRERVESRNNYTRVNYNYFAKKTHPSAHRNMVPRAVLMKTGLKAVNTARPVTTAHPKTIVYSARPMSHFSKSAQSTVKRPYQIRTTLTNKNSSQKVNTAKGKFYTARQKAVNTARPNSAVVNAVRENQVNAVKASACWVWRPTKLNSASITLKRHNYGHPQKEDQGYVDSGCSRHMTGNMSYLSNFKEFDGGYITFGGEAKGGKITGKGTLKTDV